MGMGRRSIQIRSEDDWNKVEMSIRGQLEEGMWIGFIFKTQSPIFPIDDRMYQIIMVYLTGFFGNRSIKSWRGEK